ncbi:MAG: Ribosomal large subunit pseudouridine synthase C [Eubacteriales bacterium SKADARSKE-1]|nr:Ribosomal large subunit pseudouridine synthase C [Eubacteriales bacterium SKADARSKE-1]
MKTITITENDAGQRLDKFLNKSFKNLPLALMYKCIRKKDIKVNGKRCKIDTRLNVGDILTLYVKNEFFESSPTKYDFLKAPSKVDVVYEDKNILLVNKKPGLIVHSDKNYHFDSLISRIQHYLFERGEYEPNDSHSFSPALANRIDRNTGGIVIAAKNAETLRILNSKIKDREIKKFYLCIVHGILQKKEDVLTAYLEKNEPQNRVYIHLTPSKNTKIIKTKYKVIDEKENFSLLEVELLTGRTHQIRAHMASIGHSLVGDGKYGTNAKNKNTSYKWQALYSYKIKFDFKTSAEILDYLNGQTFVAPKTWFIDDFYNNLK